MEQHAGYSTPHDSTPAKGSLPQSLRINFGAGAMGMAIILNTMGGVLVCDRPVAGKRSGRSRNHGLGVFAAGILVMGPALLPDAVEYDYLKTGMRREGTLSSFYSTVEKLAFAVGPALALYFLSWFGYRAGTEGMQIEQPQSAIIAIYMGAGLTPAALNALSLVFLFKYDLSEDRLKALRASSG